jgi:hypothetical protein
MAHTVTVLLTRWDREAFAGLASGLLFWLAIRVFCVLYGALYGACKCALDAFQWWFGGGNCGIEIKENDLLSSLKSLHEQGRLPANLTFQVEKPPPEVWEQIARKYRVQEQDRCHKGGLEGSGRVAQCTRSNTMPCCRRRDLSRQARRC